jgi:SAM-dependent methyltransferase
LHTAFALPKYKNIVIDTDTVVQDLPWTPARYRKFKDAVEAELSLPCDYVGTLREIVDDLSERYILRFFGEIWKPRTGDYEHTGWQLAEEINKLDPKSVLDVGCGYHPFKGRIQNLVGIDPYNNCADYEVDILDYKVKPASHDVIIALGSINFNSRDEIEARFSHCVDLLAQGGKFYLRANPGITHKTGPYVEIFDWSFEVVNEFAEKYNLRLDTFKKDANDRLYFVYTKK